MKHIYIDTQSTYEYFLEHLVPYKPRGDEDTEEVWEWFDHWLDWLIGAKCIDGNDIEYKYPFLPISAHVLHIFNLKHEVREEE